MDQMLREARQEEEVATETPIHVVLEIPCQVLGPAADLLHPLAIRVIEVGVVHCLDRVVDLVLDPVSGLLPDLVFDPVLGLLLGFVMCFGCYRPFF